MKLASDRIESVFVRLAGIPHRLLIEIGKEEAESYLFDVTDRFLVLSEFDPRLANVLLERHTTISVRVSEVYEFSSFQYQFRISLREETEYNEMKAYLFTIPETVEVVEKPYLIVPDPGDHLTVSFRIKELQQFKKVLTLDRNEIVFSGALPFARENNGKRIERIELKLPFRRVWTSGILEIINSTTYKFTDYIQTDEDWNDLNFYATDNFIQRNRLRPSILRSREPRANAGTVGTINVPLPPLVLISDDKPIITRVMQEILEAKSPYRVITTNFSTEIVNLVRQHHPDVLLTDLHMPVKNGVEIAREIRADLSLRSTSILFMTATGDHSLESEAMKIAPVLEKPVETRDLLSRLAEAVRKSGTSVQVTDAKVFFCSDDGEYTRALPMGSWEIYPGPERILHTDAKQIKAVFVRCVGEALPALTLLNLFRARNGCDRIPVFIQPRTSGEERLLTALPDDNLTVIPRELSPSMLADKYLIPIG